MRLLSLLVALWFFAIPCLADEARQVEMMKSLFKRPSAEWAGIFQFHRELLDDEFFPRVEQRVEWDLQEGQVQDALRFATAGDLALSTIGRTPYLMALVERWMGLARPEPGPPGRFFPPPASTGQSTSQQQPGPTAGNVDLSTDRSWSLALPGQVTYIPGSLRFLPRYALGDHEQNILRPGYPESRGFLELVRPDRHDVWVGEQDGRLVWAGCRRDATELCMDGRCVARVGETVRRCLARFGAPAVRFEGPNSQLLMYRSVMADFALEIQADRVTALMVMEPGALRTQLRSLSGYREL